MHYNNWVYELIYENIGQRRFCTFAKVPLIRKEKSFPSMLRQSWAIKAGWGVMLVSWSWHSKICGFSQIAQHWAQIHCVQERNKWRSMDLIIQYCCYLLKPFFIPDTIEKLPLFSSTTTQTTTRSFFYYYSYFWIFMNNFCQISVYVGIYMPININKNLYIYIYIYIYIYK